MLDITLDGSVKTQIMYKANLSFAQLNDYLFLILKCKLVKKIDTKERTIYKTTPKGIWFLKAHQDINRLLTTETVEEALRKPSVVAVIPAYNDEESIAEVILEAQKYVDMVIVCDDSSRDKTTEMAERMGVKVLRHKRNKGYGAALRSLFKMAVDSGAEVIITLDGDGQYDPNDIPKLIQPIFSGQVDVVIGSRTLEKNQSIPLIKRLGNKAFSKLVSIVTRNKLTDVQCGFRALSRRALENLEIREKAADVNTEFLLKALQTGLTVAEVPVEYKPSRKIQVQER